MTYFFSLFFLLEEMITNPVDLQNTIHVIRDFSFNCIIFQILDIEILIEKRYLKSSIHWWPMTINHL